MSACLWNQIANKVVVMVVGKHRIVHHLEKQLPNVKMTMAHLDLLNVVVRVLDL